MFEKINKNKNFLYAFCGFAAINTLLSYTIFNWCMDDVYIASRYADILLNHDALSYNTDQRIQGFSDFLWVINNYFVLGLIKLAHLPKMLVLHCLRLENIVFLSGFQLFLFLKKGQFIKIAALTLLHFPLIIWTASPLEALLFSIMVVTFYCSVKENMPKTALLLALLLPWLRVDGIFWLGIICACFFIFNSPIRKQLVLCGIVGAASYGCYLLFSHYYYGSLATNSMEKFKHVNVVGNFFEYYLKYIVLFLLPLLVFEKRKEIIFIALLACALYVNVYVWEPGARYLLPLVLLNMKVLYEQDLTRVCESLKSSFHGKIALSVYVMVFVFAINYDIKRCFHLGSSTKHTIAITLDKDVNEYLKNVAGRVPSIMVQEAGAASFFFPAAYKIIDYHQLHFLNNPDLSNGIVDPNNAIAHYKPDALFLKSKFLNSLADRSSLMIRSDDDYQYLASNYRLLKLSKFGLKSTYWTIWVKK